MWGKLIAIRKVVAGRKERLAAKKGDGYRVSVLSVEMLITRMERNLGDIDRDRI
jgi:hypothetical protein